MLEDYFKDRAYFKKMKKILKKYQNLSLNYLNLPQIKIKYKTITKPIAFSSTYYPSLKEILISIPTKRYRWEGLRNKYTKTNVPEYIALYSLFHEIGHYWHNKKHLKHWRRYYSKYVPEINMERGKDYNEQKMEIIANKMSKILFKKYRKEIFKDLNNRK